MIWTTENQQRAMCEGWLIAENSDHGPRIERYDDSQRFNSDAAATAFVGLCASLGGFLARRAFEYLAYEWAVEDAARQEHDTSGNY